MDTLYRILNFTGLPIGGTQTLDHGLKLNGLALKPDKVDLQFPDTFQVAAATTTTLTLRNVSDAVGACQAWCEVLHPVMRSFGVAPDDGSLALHLTPQPFTTGPNTAPPFPSGPIPIIVRIFANQTGSDATGTGTQVNPYRTFKRAILDVPNVIPAGYAYIVDVTNLGTESFPAGYQIPPTQATVQEYLFLDPSTLPFVVLAALNIQATPKPFAGLPLADTTVPPGDIVAITPVGPGLTSVQVAPARASWAANGARTAMVIGSAGDAQVNCVVYGSDATHLFLANTPTHVAVQQLSLVEPSAVFSMPGPGGDGSGFESSAAESLAIQGIKFTIAGGGSANQVALGIANTLQPIMELCDVDGLVLGGNALEALTLSSVIRNFVFVQASSWAPRRCLVLNAGLSITGGYADVFRQVVFEGCDPVGPGSFATDEPAVPPGGWEFLNVLISNGTGDGVSAFGDGAYSLQEVEIDGCAGNAVSVRDSISVKLKTVTGTGNGGFGVFVQDGGQVRVLDDATVVTGTGDIKSGTLAVRTWVDFRANPPVKNQLDLVSPPVGDETTGAGSGGTSLSRVFQRP